MSTRQRTEWQCPDDESVLAWQMADIAPELGQRFKGGQTVIIELLFMIFNDRATPPREVRTTATFTVATRGDDFWGDFYSSVRQARRQLAESGEFSLNQDEADFPVYVVRITSKADSKRPRRSR